MSDELVDTNLHTGVHDVPLLQGPGDGRVVYRVHLNRCQHGHPEVLEVKQEDVTHLDIGDLLLGVIEVEVSVLDDGDVVERVEQNTCVTSGDGLDTVEVPLCIDSVEKDVAGQHECTELVLCDVGHGPHLSVGVCRVVPVDGCGPVCLPHGEKVEDCSPHIDDVTVDVVLYVCVSGLVVESSV